MKKNKLLIIDNNIDQDEFGFWPMGKPFLPFFSDFEIQVRRGPQNDLPEIENEFSHVLISGSKTSCLSNEDWVNREINFLKQSALNGKKILGVCFGHQLLARAFGKIEHVRKSIKPEHGWVEIEIKSENKILKGLPKKFYSYQSHVEEVSLLDSDLILSAHSTHCAVQSFSHKSLPVFGIQFHPESEPVRAEKVLKEKLKDKSIPKDCIFNAGRADSLYSEKVAKIIFDNFIKL